MAKDRATSAEFQERVKEVMAILLDGHTRAQIIRHAAEQWKVGARQVDNYIAEANKEIDEANEGTAERHLAVITSNLWRIYRNNRDIRPSVARLALINIARLRGLEKMEIAVTFERPLKEMSDEELNAALG